MVDFGRLQELVKKYDSLKGAETFFQGLGYPTIEPLPFNLESLPQGAREPVKSLHQLVRLGDGSPFRVFHVELRHSTIRRTDIRRFLEAFYHHYPQGNNLFVFSAGGNFDELHFVSPRRILVPQDPDRDTYKVRLWLRILPVQRERPYRTDLETLDRIRADGLAAEEVWRRHEEAFSVQRVSEQFFRDYQQVFGRIEGELKKAHPHNEPVWARDYTHQLLNRIMFLYFIARKGWLLGPDKGPDRDFMRHFWEAYREGGEQDAFHREWLRVLFFEAFNNRWQNRPEYLKRFPRWLVETLAQAPFLNGGLYRRTPLDEALGTPLPDAAFELLFEKWMDGTSPGLFERYNFTVVESGRFDEEVAVDPEMLGTVYERLVNITFEGSEEDLRGQAGIFYTPRTEIDLMCRIALLDWLSNQVGREHSELIYRWVFAFYEEEKLEASKAITDEGLWEKLNEAIRRVRVCDPACGSGSFLVGMMLVLDDLQTRCNAVLGIDETPYERRKRILQDQLYGVDVMEWAVRVAELRLWLQLVVETELEPAELHFRPLLPNLNFKLRHGDSLLQTVGDLDFSPFRRPELPIPRHLKGRITQLQGKKRRFFQGEAGLSEEALKQEEQALFRDILAERIHALQNEIARKEEEKRALISQTALPGMERSKSHQEAERRLEEAIQELREKLARYQEAHEALRPDQPTPFVWDIAFVEVFGGDNPGFDIIIGNPPYVRQEKIRDYLNRFDRKEYLARLNESLRAIYPGFLGKSRKIAGRADYYIYFYLHALSLLAEGGSFCFITSNSWLDVDFGKDLQEFFLRFGHLKMVIDNQRRRSFAQADVNTVIVLAGPPERKRPLSEDEMRARTVRFVAFRVPFEEAMSPVVFLEVADDSLYRPLAHFRVLRRPEFRAVLLDQWALYQEGLGEDAGGLMEASRYEGNKWGGKYLRAPDVFFTILEKGKGKLVRLGEIAEVRRGFTTGANEFFYLEPVGKMVKEVAELAEKAPQAPVRVRNGAGWEGEIEAMFLKPFLFSLKEAESIHPNLQHLCRCVFVCSLSIEQLDQKGYQHALAYIQALSKYNVKLKHGGECLLPKVPSLRGRNPWYALPQQQSPHFIVNRFIGERFLFLEGGNFLVCDVFFVGYLKDPTTKSTVVALLNSSLTALIADIFARKTYGIGVAYLYGPEINSLFLLNPSLLSGHHINHLISAFVRLSQRPIRSIFEELGFTLCRERECEHPEHPYEHVNPQALTLEQVRLASPDRFELDRVVFDVLGLTDEERLQVYQAVAELVKTRLVKARSVGGELSEWAP